MSIKKGKLKPLITTLIGILAILAYIWVNDPYMIYIELSKAHLPLVLIAIIINTIALFFSILTWHSAMLSVNAKVPFSESAKATLISIFGDMMIPTGSIAGESMRLLYLRRKEKLGWDDLVIVFTIHRIVSIIMFLAFMATGTIILPTGIPLIGKWVIVSLLIIATLMSIMLWKLDYAELLISPILHLLQNVKIIKEPENIERKALRFITDMKKGVSAISRRKRYVVLMMIATSSQWLLAAGVQYFIFKSLGYTINFSILAIVYPIYMSLTLMPIGIPAGLGVVETGMTLTFMSVGISRETAVAGTLLARAVILLYDIIVSGTAFIKYSKYLLKI